MKKQIDADKLLKTLMGLRTLLQNTLDRAAKDIRSGGVATAETVHEMSRNEAKLRQVDEIIEIVNEMIMPPKKGG